MSIADRKARNKENLRALILESARKQFVENGIEQTNIRTIAENIDYSIGTVYKHFKDKNTILHALHTKGFMDLGKKFQTLSNADDPMERLKSMGKIYIDFAKQHPDMYDLMFNLKAPMAFLDTAKQDNWNEGKATFGLLKSTVKECISAGYFKGHHLEPLSFLIWSSVHGMCSLEIRERTKGVNLKNPASIVKAGYREFIMLLDKN